MIKQEVYAIVNDFRIADYQESVVTKVFIDKNVAIAHLDRMEIVLRMDYDWSNHRQTYEKIERGENFVRGTYGKMSCEYRIERADLIINN